MYIAISIMLAAMLLGRLCKGRLPIPFLKAAINGAIFLLLFLLGVAIGGNDNLINQLPTLGWDALLLTIFCLAGSIFASVLISRFFKSR